MSYKFLEHTGDVKFRAEGSTIEGMFVSAAEALLESVRGGIKVNSVSEERFEVEGSDIEELLYNFLEEFLFMLDSEGFLVSKVKSLKIDNNRIKCVVLGDDSVNYRFTNDVKAVTYSGMFVRKENGRYVCEVVLDV